MSGTYRKIARQNKMPALGVCFPQTFPSAGRRLATSKSRFHDFQQIVSFPQQQIE